MWYFFVNDTATTEIYTLSLHDALPISDPHGALRVTPDRPEPAVGTALEVELAGGRCVFLRLTAPDRRCVHVASPFTPPPPSCRLTAKTSRSLSSSIPHAFRLSRGVHPSS